MGHLLAASCPRPPRGRDSTLHSDCQGEQGTGFRLLWADLTAAWHGWTRPHRRARWAKVCEGASWNACWDLFGGMRSRFASRHEWGALDCSVGAPDSSPNLTSACQTAARYGC